MKRCEIPENGGQKMGKKGGKIIHLRCIFMSEQQQMDKNGERWMEGGRKARLLTQAPPLQQWCMMGYE